MKERNNNKRMKSLEHKRYKGITIPREKVYQMDKKVKKKLKEEGYEIDYGNFIDPLADIPELQPDLKELEEPSRYIEEIKNSKTLSCNSNKHANKGKRITYEEWLDKKNAEDMYWNVLIEAEKKEQEQLEVEKKKEVQKVIEER